MHFSQIDRDCFAMHREGNSSWEILDFVKREGFPYSQAVRIVKNVLRLDAESVAEMEDKYKDCI